MIDSIVFDRLDDMVNGLNRFMKVKKPLNVKTPYGKMLIIKKLDENKINITQLFDNIPVAEPEIIITVDLSNNRVVPVSYRNGISYQVVKSHKIYNQILIELNKILLSFI